MAHTPEGHRPNKRLGQNFMTDASDLEAIASSLTIEPGERVLEIGPGAGALTRLLLGKGAKVLAVEKDRFLAALLKKKFPEPSLEVVEGDILEQDPSALFPGASALRVFGNIPYNITSPILFWLIDHRRLIREAALTVQWEVAQRLTGKPGTKMWGALSVSAGAYADISVLRKIPRGHFSPAPKVDSALIRLVFLEVPRYPEAEGELFHLLVAKAFQKRRKTLLNALERAHPDLGRALLSEVFRELGFEPRQRPETLSIQDWCRLTARLSRSPKK